MMAGKTLTAARQQREKFLLEFQSACDDLEDETNPSDGKQPNERKLKNKMNLVRTSYDEAIEAHAGVITLEKTSASDEVNRTWVKTNLRNPFKKLIEAAEDKLGQMGVEGDLEAEAKVQNVEEKREAQFGLATLEAQIAGKVESLSQAFSDTTIWLSDNHGALTQSVNKLEEDLVKTHQMICKTYLRLLEDTKTETEAKRQQEFRSEKSPKIADLQAKLLSKTPAKGPAQQPFQPQQVVGGQGGGVQRVAQPQVKFKMKLAPMSIPTFSGKVVDYPEWKKLFKDCVEVQYEESASVMILRTQALPDSLRYLVPRCANLASIWEKLDKKYLDPSRVWKGVKQDLLSLDRKKLGKARYMVDLVNKLLDAEILLDTVGMVHWLRQEDKIPEYEDFLSQEELLEWVRLKPKLSGTPWENFKSFLLKMKDEYEELAKAGTVMEDNDDKRREEKTCDYCDRKNHVESECRKKKADTKGNHEKPEAKRKCWKCGSEEHIARDCTTKVVRSGNKVKVTKVEQDTHSNYLRSKDCRWCGRTYNSSLTCSGCNTVWAAKVKADHCLAHCSKYSGASAKDRGEMVVKGGNCLICLHHEHTTDSCFGKDQQRTICGMEGCTKRHHPSLHSAPQGSVQAVQTASHLSVSGSGESVPGVTINDKKVDMSGLQGRFMSRINAKRVQSHKITWNEGCWTGGTGVRLEQQRSKELQEMHELLQLPVVEGDNVSC